MRVLRRPGFWVLAFAILIRALYAFEIRGTVYFDHEGDAFDQINFHKGALALAAGDWKAPSPSELYSPLYKYLLGAVYAAASPFTGLTIGAARLVQLAAGVGVAWWVYRLVRLWGGTAAGVLASLLYSAFGPALFMESKLLREFPATAFMVWALWTGRDGPASRGRWLGSAVLMGMACQLRSNLQLVALVFMARAWMAGAGHRWRDRLLPAGLWAAVFAASVLPSMVRNVIVLSDPARQGCVPLTPPGLKPFFTIEPQGPMVLAVTHHPSQDRIYCCHSGIHPDPELHAYGETLPISMGTTVRMILRWAAEDPAAFLRLYLRKAYWSVWDGEVASNHCFQLWQEWAPALRLPVSHFAPWFALAAVGLAFPHARRAVPWTLWAALGAVLAGVLIAFPAGRVRAPAFPLLFASSALILCASVRLARTGRILPVAAHLVLAGALSWLLWPPEPAWIVSATGMSCATSRRELLRPIDLNNVAVTFGLRRTFEGVAAAEPWFLRARNQELVCPGQHSEATALLKLLYGPLCSALIKRGLHEAAIRAALRWERLDPCEGASHAIMALALEALGEGDAGRLAGMRAWRRHAQPPLLEARSPDPDAAARVREAREQAQHGSKRAAAASLTALAGQGRLVTSEDLLLLAELAAPSEAALVEWALLRTLEYEPGELRAHAKLASFYHATGMDHRALPHVKVMAESGVEAEMWKPLYDGLQVQVEYAVIPLEVPEEWVRNVRCGGRPLPP